MKITVFGTGYVGLVQGAVLADAGHEVVCVDVDAAKIAKLEQGIIPIHEPGLDSVVRATVAAGRLAFTTDAAAGVAHGEIQFLAVGTPPDEDGSADLQYVLAVAESIATHMDGYRVIVDKSTVPVGTADKVAAKVRAVLAARGAAHEFDVVSMRSGKSIMALVAHRGFHCNLVAGESLSFVRPHAPSDLHATTVRLPISPTESVSGWFARGTGRGAVLLLHGVRGDRTQMLDRARFLRAEGYSVLLIDLPAHGESSGERITFGAREGAGVTVALRYLIDELPGERVGVIGVSLGAASLVLSRPSPPPSAAVLESMYPEVAPRSWTVF